jgi:HEAT repeat protein
VGSIGDADEEVSASACRSLGRNWDVILRSNLDQGISRAVVSRLVEALKDTRPVVRAAAADGLYGILTAPTVARGGNRTGLDDSATLVNALTESLSDATEEVLIRGTAALGALGVTYRLPPPEMLFTALRQDSSSAVRAAAARSLGRFREGLESVTLALLRALDDQEPQVRGPTREALRLIHELGVPRVRHDLPSAAIVPSLIEALASRNPEVRYNAAALLTRFGTEAEAAIPALLVVLAEPVDPKTLQEPNAAVYWDPSPVAARVLSSIAPGSSRSQEAITALNEVLASSQSWQRRGEAAKALAMFGKEVGEPSIALLLKVLSETNNSDKSPGEYVARALGDLAPGTPWEMKVVAGLLSALDAKWNFTRTAAARSLAKFGTQASGALPRLRAMAERDKYATARQAAAGAIVTIQAGMQQPKSD